MDDRIVFNAEIYISATMKKMIRYFFKKGANYAEFGITPALRNFAVYTVQPDQTGLPCLDQTGDFLHDGWDFKTETWAAYLKESLAERYVNEIMRQRCKEGEG